MGNPIRCTAALLCLAFPAFAMAQMYTCTDANGKKSFSDQPCPQKPGVKQEVREAPRPSTLPQASGKGSPPVYRPFTADERAKVVRQLTRTSSPKKSERQVSQMVAEAEKGCSAGKRGDCDTLTSWRVQTFGITTAERKAVQHNITAGGVTPATDVAPNPKVFAGVVDEWERNCASGVRQACDTLASYRSKSAQQLQREHLEKECARGRYTSACDQFKNQK